MLSRTRYAYSGRCRRLYSFPSAQSDSVRIGRRAPVGARCLGGRQAGRQTDCGCRFRLEKHPEQSKPVSVHRGVAAAVLGEIRSLDRGLA